MKNVFARRLVLALAIAGSALVNSSQAQVSYQSIASFGSPVLPGAEPHSGLIQGADGALYGTTQLGGNSNAGTVFKMNCDGSGYTVLHVFGGNDGQTPYGRLAQGASGNLFGTTVFGGTNGYGTVFTLDTNGESYAVLHHFSTNRLDGEFPHTGLLIGMDGRLYGTTTTGGTNGFGTVFALKTDGTGFAILRGFVTNTSYADGNYPRELIQGTDGFLYGMTEQDGNAAYYYPNGPLLFRMNMNGGNYLQLKLLSTPVIHGRSHHGGVIQGSDGMLYGTVYNDSGISPFGGIFVIATNGSNYGVLHPCTNTPSDGEYPDGRVIQGTDGALYGTTTAGGTNGLGTVFKMNKDGSGFTLLYSFGGFAADGQWPSDTLILGTDGNLYGTTLLGGSSGEGTIYKIGTDGSSYTVLHNFNRATAAGQLPAGKLIRGTDGALYGATIRGGSNNLGTIFKINPGTSNYVLLHTFGSTGDGQQPFGGLIQGADGDFYGTTSAGGTNGGGTIYTISGDGSSYAILYDFSNAPDGNLPSGRLVQGSDGTLYGVTGAGGTNSAGTVFTIQTNGNGYAVLYDFNTNGTDGWGPVAGLTFGTNGALYGTTADGGPNSGGDIFEINTDGSGYSVLHTFNTNGTDGMAPYGELALGADGGFYGTTRLGGSNNFGTAFRIHSDGSGYMLQNLGATASDAQEPAGELAGGSDGVFYGTAFYGGSNDVGAVFQFRTNGFGYAVLQQFSKTSGDGRNPPAGLFQDTDGTLYGNTEFGGGAYSGTLFELGLGAPTIVGQPQSQTVLLGANVFLSVTAIGNSLAYQWFFNGSPVTNAADSVMLLTDVARTNGGIYTVSVSNTLTGLTSSNAVLTIQIPPQFLTAPTVLPDGSFELTSAYTNNYPIDPSDLSNFEAQTSSNLLSWQTLSNSLSWSNGVLILHDVYDTNQPALFYRIIEH